MECDSVLLSKKKNGHLLFVTEESLANKKNSTKKKQTNVVMNMSVNKIERTLNLWRLLQSCEFLIHAVVWEGKASGIEKELAFNPRRLEMDSVYLCRRVGSLMMLKY